MVYHYKKPRTIIETAPRKRDAFSWIDKQKKPNEYFVMGAKIGGPFKPFLAERDPPEEPTLFELI